MSDDTKQLLIVALGIVLAISVVALSITYYSVRELDTYAAFGRCWDNRSSAWVACK